MNKMNRPKKKFKLGWRFLYHVPYNYAMVVTVTMRNYRLIDGRIWKSELCLSTEIRTIATDLCYGKDLSHWEEHTSQTTTKCPAQ